MQQLIIMIVSFALIPILTSLKVKYIYALLACAALLGTLSGIGLAAVFDSVSGLIILESNRDTLLTVMMICIVSGLMTKYGITDRLVHSIQSVVVNPKTSLMLVPAVFGLLIIPGGAVLSVPFTAQTGDSLSIPKDRQAAINLVFRHISMFIMPYSTSLLIVASVIPEINMTSVILLNSVFVLFMVIIGYYLYIRNLPWDRKTQNIPDYTKLPHIILYLTPIISCVVLNMVTGIPLYLTMFSSVLIIILLGGKEDLLKTVWTSMNWKLTGMIAIVLVIKEMIGKMDAMIVMLQTYVQNLTGVIPILLVFCAVSILLGMSTGFQVASLGIILPLLNYLQLASRETLFYVYFVFCATYLGYFFSPLHMCQLFTNDYLEVKTIALYREYRYFIVLMVLNLIITSGVLYFLLL